MPTEYDEMADLVASDIGPVYALTREEALMLVRGYFWGSADEAIQGVAEALYQQYREEEWS